MEQVDFLMSIRNKFQNKIVNRICIYFAKRYGCIIGNGASIGENVHFTHNAVGSVITTHCKIHDGVRIMSNVTIGDSFSGALSSDTRIPFIEIESGAILSSGCRILCKRGNTLHIGRNSIIAANAVVLHDVPDNEIWGGCRLLKSRIEPSFKEEIGFNGLCCYRKD